MLFQAEVRANIMVNSFCKTHLNAKNIVKAINKYAINLINYYIDLYWLELKYFAKQEKEIQQILNEYSIHNQLACLEKFYLPRSKLEKGLHSMNIETNRCCWIYITMRLFLVAVEQLNYTHLSRINSYLH